MCSIDVIIVFVLSFTDQVEITNAEPWSVHWLTASELSQEGLLFMIVGWTIHSS